MPLRDMPREQAWLLPPSLDELLPLDHPARFVAEFVDALDREDWKELGVNLEGYPLGAPAYHPRALLSVWLYGFVTGIRSSRKLEAACRDQIPYLWLTGRQHPDHNTLRRFYKDNRQAMRSLFKRTVRTAVAMELVDLAVQAVDGTKVAANASSGRSYDAEGLAKLLERLDRAITEMEDQNEGETDRAPVHLHGMIASDAILFGEYPNPRTTAASPSCWPEFVRAEKHLRLPEAIRKMTSFPAQRVGIPDRQVSRGAAAVQWDSGSGRELPDRSISHVCHGSGQGPAGPGAVPAPGMG